MRARAPGRAAEDRAYAELRRRLLGTDDAPVPCEVCPTLAAAGVEVSCTTRATELHHRRKLSASGARAHPYNVVPSCHNGNQAVERWPIEARSVGLAVREGDPDWEALSARAWRLEHG